MRKQGARPALTLALALVAVTAAWFHAFFAVCPLFGATSGAGVLSALQLTVPFAPHLVRSPNWQHVAYEVDISEDYRARGCTLARVEVLDAASEATPLRTYEGAALTGNLLFPEEHRDITIPMLLVWLKIEPSHPVPAALIHRFHFLRLSDGGAVTLTGARTAVDQSPVRVIAPPLKGERLAAFETSDERVHHFRLPVMVGGLTKNPQRFAVDWMVLTPDGKLRTEPGTLNTDYPGWGANLLAVADGTVADARDDLPDWEGWFTDVGRVKPTDVTGNHVYLDIGQGHHAVYAHCMKGSVAVKTGDRVQTGQVVCKMGNSGVSNCPHLHFQISNGPDPLVAESVPYVLDRFVRTGNAARVMEVEESSFEPLATPRVVTERIPDRADVVTLGP
jgi:hypothetical protein